MSWSLWTDYGYDKHQRCAWCRDKGQGNDPCIQNQNCEYCNMLTPKQVTQLSTPYNFRKEKQKDKDTLVNPASVTILSPVDNKGADQATSHNTSSEFSLPQPSFCKELQEMDEKWSIRMARLEGLLTLGHRPSPKPSFSLVIALVKHKPLTGALSQTPFLLSPVPSSQASLASGLDGIQTNKSLDMSSPLENLYPDTDLEPVFAQPGPVSLSVPVADPLLVTAQDVIPLEQFEEGEVSDLEDQQDLDAGDLDRAISEDLNYGDTV